MDIHPSSHPHVRRLRVKETPGLDVLCSFSIIGGGFALTKADLFPVEAARGVGQMILVRCPCSLCTLPAHCAQNIVMPCLLFSRIVPAFDSQNVKNIGACLCGHTTRLLIDTAHRSSGCYQSCLWCPRLHHSMARQKMVLGTTSL